MDKSNLENIIINSLAVSSAGVASFGIACGAIALYNVLSGDHSTKDINETLVTASALSAGYLSAVMLPYTALKAQRHPMESTEPDYQI